MLLILFGGLVTNTGSALAVPDWPTTFGYNMFTYPWSQMVGGIFYEHSHRLLGSTVGMLVIALAIALWRYEERAWMRRLGLVALVGVIAQGVLGGMRVVLLEHGLAIIHGCVAQAFLGLMVSITVFTSSAWRQAQSISHVPGAQRVRWLAAALIVLVYAQLVFGALLTHTGNRLDAHLLGAALVTTMVMLLASRVLREHPERALLRRPALLLVALVVGQLGLGLGAYLWHFTPLAENLPFSAGLTILAAHRVTGTAVWATSLVLSLRVLRVVALPDRAAVALVTKAQSQVLA